MIIRKWKVLIFSLFIIFFITSCWKNNEEVVKKPITEIIENDLIKESVLSDYINFAWWDLGTLTNEFWDLTSSWSLKDLNDSINNEDFKKTQEIINTILVEIDSKKDLTVQDKVKIQALKYIKVMSVLSEWNYFYKEKEKSEEAIKIIQEIISENPNSKDVFFSNYYSWYAKEIVKDYTWALDFYNIILEDIPETEKNKNFRSIALNQIWHVYDLKWEIDKAYKYYYDAYNLVKQNYRASINIARYLTRTWKIDEAKIFFEYSLWTLSRFLKSEIYFSLSSLELELNWLKPDINKSIEYANLSISSFPDYPMWYVALARWYYMLNDSKYDKDIENNLNKSIKLNPNWNEAYRYYALYYLDQKDLDKSIENIELSKNVIDDDMILMSNQKDLFKYLNDILKVYVSITNNNIETIYSLYNNNKLEYFIKTQLKRRNSWVYKNLEKQDSFIKITNYFNK
jgi:tetratricopeptide (TPR) repeat protein